MTKKTTIATGSEFSAAIGGGYEGAGGTIKLLGGNITAKKSVWAEAVGNGYGAFLQ